MSTGRERLRALDISSLASWTGPPIGMLRVERELAEHALSCEPGIVPVIYDDVVKAFREVRRHWIRDVIDWNGNLQRLGRESGPQRKGWRHFVPSRGPLIKSLERRRRAGRSASTRWAYDRLQRVVLGIRVAPIQLHDKGGRRLNLVPYEDAIGECLAFSTGDVLLSASSDWERRDLSLFRAMKSLGVRVTVLCYDLIPLTHPEFFPGHEIERFRVYWDAVLALADAVVVNAAAIARDLRCHCERIGLPDVTIRTVPLGCGTQSPLPPAAVLPSGLERGRFVLYVSTIEARKNHAMLLRVWRRLLALGVPQAARYRLVFVGRRGWMVDDVLALLDRPEPLEGTLIHLEGVDDQVLWHLVDAAGFCVYPSNYEGFGLPVVEAMARGKAVAVSSAGSLPEAVAGCAPLLDPGDDESWLALIRHWIETPSALAAAECRVRRDFVAITWDEVAGRLFAIAGLTEPPEPG